VGVILSPDLPGRRIWLSSTHGLWIRFRGNDCAQEHPCRANDVTTHRRSKLTHYRKWSMLDC